MKLLAIRKGDFEPVKFKGYLFIKRDMIIPNDYKIIQHDGRVDKYYSCINLKTKYVHHSRFNHLNGTFLEERRGMYEVGTLDSVENYLLFDYDQNVKLYKNNTKIWNLSMDKLPSFHSRTMVWDESISHDIRDKGKTLGFAYYNIETLEKCWEYRVNDSERNVKSISLHGNIIMLGFDNKSKIGLNRKNGKQLWRCIGTHSHNLNTFPYKGNFINYHGLEFIEVDAVSGKICRKAKLTHLEKDGVRSISTMRIEEDRIFFFNKTKIGILDYNTLKLLDLERVSNLSEKDNTEFLRVIQIHGDKIYLVGITNQTNSVSYIYQT